jgi:hypothetical protein
MSRATDKGFRIGEKYKVINDGRGAGFYKVGMIVEFNADDGTESPRFKYISHPNHHGREGCYIRLEDLEPLKVASHLHAESMLEYAKDAATMLEPWKNWENKSITALAWGACTTHPEWNSARNYRRKPITVRINGIEVPRGVAEEPAYDTLVFICELEEADYCYPMRWENRSDFKRALERGVVHLSKENAQAMSKAMLKFQ